MMHNRTKQATVRRASLWALGCAILIFFAQACGPRHHQSPVKRPKPYRVWGTWYQPIAHARGFEQTGIASWYGKKFHGRKTANGEIYDMYAMTAAHKTLPLGTFVRVHSLENGKSVDVRVNDRGPFVRGRIIDLSYTAADKLGIVGPGTGRVRVVALGARRQASRQTSSRAASRKGKPRYTPLDYYAGNFTFQVGAFAERANAAKLVSELQKLYKNAHMSTFHDGRRTFHRVRVGRSKNLEQAIAYEQELIRDGFAQAFIVAE